jgi:hypothetical protein
MTGLLKKIFADLPTFVSPLAAGDVMPVVQNTLTTPETRQMTYTQLITELSTVFAGTDKNLFLENTASDFGVYKSLHLRVPAGAKTHDSASISAADTVINEYAGLADLFLFVAAQVMHVHVHLAQTAGTKTSTAYVKIFHRTSGGTETLLGTSAVTPTLAGVETAYDLDVSISDTVFSTTDRLVLKVYASPAGTGTTPTCNVYFQGDTNSRVGFAGTAETGNFVTLTGTQTLTNKRISPRVVAVTVNANPTYNIDNGDIFTITSQNAAITSMTTNLSGTPVSGQKIMIEILDDGTARAITWGASFASGPGTLPTTTTISKWLYVGFEYSASRSKWICLAAGSEQ